MWLAWDRAQMLGASETYRGEKRKRGYEGALPEKEEEGEALPEEEGEALPWEKYKQTFNEFQKIGSGSYGVVKKIEDIESKAKYAAKYVRFRASHTSVSLTEAVDEAFGPSSLNDFTTYLKERQVLIPDASGYQSSNDWRTIVFRYTYN